MSDFILNGKNVGQVTVVAVSPDMAAVVRVDELSCDANALSRLAHTAFEHVSHPEFPADLIDLHRLALIGERGVARDDEQA